MDIHHCIAQFFMISIEMKLKYGLSRTEPSHAGFNHLKHRWEASGSVNWSWAAPIDQLHCPRPHERALSYTYCTGHKLVNLCVCIVTTILCVCARLMCAYA